MVCAIILACANAKIQGAALTTKRATERGKAAPSPIPVAVLRLQIAELALPNPAIVSDSFEALRAMAAEGAIAAILPTSVANRSHDEALTELDLGLPPKVGSHKILLVSPKNCDPHESEYLASELRELFIGLSSS